MDLCGILKTMLVGVFCNCDPAKFRKKKLHNNYRNMLGYPAVSGRGSNPPSRSRRVPAGWLAPTPRHVQRPDDGRSGILNTHTSNSLSSPSTDNFGQTKLTETSHRPPDDFATRKFKGKNRVQLRPDRTPCQFRGVKTSVGQDPLTSSYTPHVDNFS